MHAHTRLRRLTVASAVGWFLAGCHEPAPSPHQTAPGPPRVEYGVTAAGPVEPRAAAAAATQPDVKSAAVQEEAASARSAIVDRPAPDFTLPDQDGRRVTLSTLRGQWVVLYFYPKDDTPGCTTEAIEFTELASRFAQLHARIYGVSADPVASHRSFIDRRELRVALLSDGDSAVMKAYGASVEASLGEERYGRVIRSTVLIDPAGVIRHHWPEVIPRGHAERVSQKLAEVQARSR
jgi:peroxiredoxin Q/BCP